MADVYSSLWYFVSWRRVFVVVRAFLALLLMWFALPASALLQPTTSTPIVRWTYSNNVEDWYSDALASCRGTSRPTLTLGNTTGAANHQSTTCLSQGVYQQGSAVQKFICPSTGAGSRFGYAIAPSETSCGAPACPANSSSVSGGCQCDAGYNESGAQCVQNQCAANKGKTTIVNWTVGFTRSADSDDTKLVGVNNPWPNAGEVCNAGCLSFGDPYNENSQAFKSQVPTAQGLYRLSMDIPVTNSGDACTPTTKDQAMSPAAAEPPCPGYVGEVNGKLGCYGTAEKPVNPTNSLPPPKPPIAGNPPAGPKPASGEASGQGSAGRTPSGGAGGNAGGPAAAGAGGKGGGAGGAAAGTGSGTGTGSNTGGRVANPGDGTEQAACGAPGQPVCAVKVDENGVPTGGGDGVSPKGLNDAMDQAESKINEVIKKDGMDTSWVELPNWLSSQDCSPWQFGTLPIINMNLSLNICAMQPFAVMVMSFLWVVGTFFAIVSMVGRVVGAGVH